MVYFYFYFLLQVLEGLGTRVQELLDYVLLQWRAFYGLQLSIFLVCWLDPLVGQGKAHLAQGFGLGRFALIFCCYGLRSLGFGELGQVTLSPSSEEEDDEVLALPEDAEEEEVLWEVLWESESAEAEDSDPASFFCMEQEDLHSAALLRHFV